MADLETDLRTPSSNWIDSGGTYDPFLTGPTQPFGPQYTCPADLTAGRTIRLKSPIARVIHALTWVVFAAFVIGVVFFLEPLAAIFDR